MFERELPARPHLDQYRKQAKELLRDCAAGRTEAFERMRRNHPRLHALREREQYGVTLKISDTQLVIARENGFESWPKFARHLEMLARIRQVESLTDPIMAFLEVACAPRHASHASGTLEDAEAILTRYPHVARANIYTAAVLADVDTVRKFLELDSESATATGGPHGWDPLTHLCFSRYLRIDKSRAVAFLETARVLLDAGASAKTGWVEMIDHPTPRPTFESAIYGAAGLAHHAELTRLLLEHGADPNDEETPYHVPEGYDNTVTKVLLESHRLNERSLACMLVRKADWHDEAGMQMVLGHGGNPNFGTQFRYTALQHAIRRDNSEQMIALLLDAGGDPLLPNMRDRRSAVSMAARRGRGDLLRLFADRGIVFHLEGIERLIATCALADSAAASQLVTQETVLFAELLQQGGTLLAEFAGNGNTEGVECLLKLGISVDALYQEGDPYFDIAKQSTALHVGSWRAMPKTVKALIAHGAAVNARDGKGATPLMLAVKACVNSYWSERRTPESVEALLTAGASVEDIEIPSGYEAVDVLLQRYREKKM